MARPVKLNQQQLRSIIRQVVRQRLTEADDHFNIGEEVGSFLAQALVDELDQPDTFDTLTSNAWEVMMGTLGEEGVPVPGRMEDVEAWSEIVATYVMRSEAVKEVVMKMAKNMLKSLMDYQGAPKR